jgi:hypothetical protein
LQHLAKLQLQHVSMLQLQHINMLQQQHLDMLQLQHNLDMLKLMHNLDMLKLLHNLDMLKMHQGKSPLLCGDDDMCITLSLDYMVTSQKVMAKVSRRKKIMYEICMK